MKKIVEATYPNLNFADSVQEMDCEKDLSSGKHLACKWQKAVQIMSTVAAVHPKMRVDIIYSVSVLQNIPHLMYLEVVSLHEYQLKL